MIINKLFTFIFLIFSIVSNASNIPTFKDVGETLYIGIDNTINIVLNGCDPELVDLKVSSGHLRKMSDSTYLVTISQVEDEIKIKLYYKKVVCEIKSLKSERIPEPTLVFEFENDGKIYRKKSTNLGKLSFIYPTSYPEHQKSKLYHFLFLW